MVRSDWLRTLIVMLASTGLVWGQQAPPLPGPTPGAAEKTITVQEPDKPARKCKVLRAWQTAGGAMAYQVKALDTGEVMTIEESGAAAPVVDAPAGSHVRALATRIFHWGSRNTPPEGAPMPPAEVVQVAGAAPAPAPTRIQPVPQSDLPVVINQPPPPAPSLPVVISGTDESASRPPLGSRVKDMASHALHGAAPAPAAWPPAFAEKTAPAAAPAPAPAAPATPVAAAPAPAAPIRPVAAVTPAPTATPLPPGPPCPCEQCQTCTPGTVVEGPVIIEGSAPKATGGLLPRLSALVKRKQQGPQEVIISETEVKPVVVTGTAPPAKAAGDSGKPAYLADSQLPPKPPVEPAKPGDWRQSWGKLDQPQAGKVQVAQVTPVKGADASVPAPPRPFMSATPPPPKAEAKRADPLKDPESYTRLPADLKPAKAEPDVRPAVKTEGPRATPATREATASKDAAPALPTPTSALTDGRGGMPLGSRSVMDAGSPTYVPVPIVTLPDSRRSPAPPAPQLPKPPEPNAADMNNAFTNPAANPPAGMPAQAGNAFSPPPPPPEQPPAPTGAFGNVPPGMMAGMPAMMPPGYAGYGRPGMYPPPPMARPMYQPMPGPTMNQAVYQPNPMAGQPVRPAAYLPPAAQAAGRQETMPALSSTMSPAEAMATLRDSLYPSQREWAADRLASIDWRSNGEAVQALVAAAQKDPAPSVRAACVRTLAHMRVNTVPVVSAIQALKADSDPRVVHEVEEALVMLAPESTPAGGPGIQRAGAFAPSPR